MYNLIKSKDNAMKYIWITIVTCFLLQLLSCEEESAINPDYEKVVVQAYLYAGEQVNDIKIMETIPMGSEADTLPVINDAIVSLVKNNHTYDLVPSSGDSGYYHYPGTDLAVEEGDKFTIQIDYFNKRTTGSTTVPSQPSNVSQSNDTIFIPAKFNPWQFKFDTTKHQVKVKWTAESDAMYFIKVENVESDPDSVMSRIPPKGLPGRMVSMPMNQDFYIILFEDITHYGRHKVTLYRINQEYVDLYISRHQNSRELNEPLTNIKDGLGVFSAFSSVELYFTATAQ
jgi:hypothetical protein